MASHSLGLSLHEAARRMGVPFIHENEPVDRFVEANGLRFHCLEWGDPAKPTVLMLHGVSQQAHSWDFISLPLSADYHVLALDQRGHGDSDWAEDSDYSLDAMVGDMDAIVPALGLDGGPSTGSGFHLMGHSMGGRNSFVWASRHPGALRSLTIVDTGPETVSRGRQRIQRFQKLPDNLDTLDEFADRIQEYTGRTREQVLGALKYSIRQGSDGKWTWKYDRVIRERGRQDGPWSPEQLWDCWRRIDCPTLVTRGDRSDVFADDILQRMGQEIADCTTVTVSNAGHLVQGDNPPEFLAAAQAHLDRAEGR